MQPTWSLRRDMASGAAVQLLDPGAPTPKHTGRQHEGQSRSPIHEISSDTAAMSLRVSGVPNLTASLTPSWLGVASAPRTHALSSIEKHFVLLLESWEGSP